MEIDWPIDLIRMALVTSKMTAQKIYCTRAIITRGLYYFYPIFDRSLVEAVQGIAL